MRMLDDRRASIESVQDIGDELTSQATEAEKQAIEAQLTDLNSRWNMITHQAEERQAALDDTIQVARLYHEQRDPFLEWIDVSERVWAAVDPIGKT